MDFEAQGTTMPVRPSGSLDKATNSPHYLDKILAAAKTQGRRLKIPSSSDDSDGLENLVGVTSILGIQPNLGSVTDDPETDERAPAEDSSVHKPLIPPTAGLNKQSKTLVATGGAKRNSPSSPADRREKILHMLSALEELHRSLNSTLNSRLTILTKGERKKCFHYSSSLVTFTHASINIIKQRTMF